MKKILFTLLGMIYAMPVALAMTATGTVIDENGKPLPGASVIIPGTTNGTITDLNGKFSLPDVSDGTELKISYMGYKDKTITAGTNTNVQMVVDEKVLEEVVVTGCGGDKARGIRAGQYIDGTCYPTACVTPRWELQGTEKNAQCVEQNCTIDNGTGKWVADGDTWKCGLDTCKDEWKPNGDNSACILTECTTAQKQEHPNATKTGIKKGTETCIALECKCGYELSSDKCIEWTNTACDSTQKPKLPGNASAGIKKCNDKGKAYCEISACNDGYKVSDNKRSCVSTRGDACDASAIDSNATTGVNKNQNGKIVCVITDCANGYTPNQDGTRCTPAELSEKDSQNKINELKDNAQKMKDKEQSTENKLLGAAGIGATGWGGKMLASAMAEQNADEEAEQEMRAYLATMHCNYGGGKNVQLGETNVDLPGGNELIGLYAEYVNLANDLKVRKSALGLRAGIESETILDSATSGLYDDVAMGKTSGEFASLARALMDPTGADAQMWQAQRAETAEQKKTGMITAGVGVAVGVVGNLAINSGKNKQDQTDEIIAKYEKLKRTFEDAQIELDNIPQQKQCSDFTGASGTYPNCECDQETHYFSVENEECIACLGGKIYDKTKKDCVCPNNKPVEENGTCVTKKAECDLTGLKQMDKCECVANATADDKKDCKCNANFTQTDNGQCICDTNANRELQNGECDCKNGFNKQTDGTCKKITDIIPILEENQEIATLTLKSDTTFNPGKSTLTSEAKTAIAKLNQEIVQHADLLTDGNYCVRITGHTDRTQFKKGSTMTNKILSQRRADAVKTELLTNSIIHNANITTKGEGETQCTKTEYPTPNDPRCRRVDVVVTIGKCP